jgi:hypothetical protein
LARQVRERLAELQRPAVPGRSSGGEDLPEGFREVRKTPS